MSNSLTGDVLAVLNSGSGTSLFLTVGNLFRSDDGVGPYLASRLAGLPVRVVDAGHTPENIIDQVIGLKPSRIIILDAADFGGRTG
ncbi:MAG: hydrogenase maturation protease, partial [Candidatus Omnitrophica bacterium]|nr:hydrogenase maturation protease [Candidatus Omnitrophota bacterium]